MAMPQFIERTIVSTTWIDESPLERLQIWAKHSPTMLLVSTLDGKIIWANAAFCEWSKYTLSELQRLTWMQLSVQDENLTAAIQEAQKLDAYHPTYTITKQYIPKNEKPVWGQLAVLRYPLTGDIECCLCTWDPLKNGTATAFATAMEAITGFEKRVDKLAAEIAKLTNQTEEDRFFLSAVGMVRKHPRFIVATMLVIFSIFGLNNVMELMQRVGVIDPPTKTVAKP